MDLLPEEFDALKRLGAFARIPSFSLPDNAVRVLEQFRLATIDRGYVSISDRGRKVLAHHATLSPGKHFLQFPDDL